MTEKITLKMDLNGEDGNAFMIMSLCRKAAFDEGWSAKRVEDFLNECRAGDYNHLLETVRADFDID